MSWHWLLPSAVLAIHDRLLAEHGGVFGLRDQGLLESALARPRHLAQWETPDACALAASYAWGIARDHPFVDGNKRTAWVTARLFLKRNGVSLEIPPAEGVLAFVALAEGKLEEHVLAEWLRRYLQT